MLENNPVFYVDDDTDDLEIFKEVAQSMGIATRLFNHADELLDSLLHQPPKPAVVFVDLNMPKISGFDVMQQIKHNEFLTDIPVIAFSTSTDFRMVELCKNLGADYYIPKPSRIDHLKNALQYVLNINWREHDRSKDFYHKFSRH